MPNLKLTLSEHFPNRLQTVLVALPLAVLLALMATVLVPGSADAASTKMTVLGKSTKKLTPNCGKAAATRNCSAEGRVTAYQSLATGMKNKPFEVPYAGKIVAWTISLSDPTRKEYQGKDPEFPYFNDIFGSPSQARISILKRVEKEKKGPPRFKMVRQSPVQILNPYFGTTVQFALSKPLNVIKDQIVALTIPTWAPALWRPRACDETETGLVDATACAEYEAENTWRGSRGPDKCTLKAKGDSAEQVRENVANSHPQQKVGSVKRYGCYYAPNVLLYTATLVGK